MGIGLLTGNPGAGRKVSILFSSGPDPVPEGQRGVVPQETGEAVFFLPFSVEKNRAFCCILPQSRLSMCTCVVSGFLRLIFAPYCASFAIFSANFDLLP